MIKSSSNYNASIFSYLVIFTRGVELVLVDAGIKVSDSFFAITLDCCFVISPTRIQSYNY